MTIDKAPQAEYEDWLNEGKLPATENKVKFVDPVTGATQTRSHGLIGDESERDGPKQLGWMEREAPMHRSIIERKLLKARDALATATATNEVAVFAAVDAYAAWKAMPTRTSDPTKAVRTHTVPQSVRATSDARSQAYDALQLAQSNFDAAQRGHHDAQNSIPMWDTRGMAALVTCSRNYPQTVKFFPELHEAIREVMSNLGSTDHGYSMNIWVQEAPGFWMPIGVAPQEYQDTLERPL